MSPFIPIILITGLILGTSITLTSSHWLLAWMGLEINTLAIIPLMTKHHHPRATEAATKYFLTQATAATTLLFAATTNAWISGQWEIQQMTHPLPVTLATLSLALKMGLAPLHAWLPELLQGLDLLTGLVLSTWQKLAPFALLTQILPTTPTLFIALGVASTLVGGWGGLNQTQLRKILAYSSIAHLGWMILILQYSPPLAYLSLLLYFVMTFAPFMTFKLNKSLNINSLATSSTKNPVLTALLLLSLLSLGGLPPLSGFMPKLLILQELTQQNLPLIATLAALSSLLSLYFYLRLSHAMALTTFPNSPLGTTPWRLLPTHKTLPLTLAISTTIILFPHTPTTLALLGL
uniref:NADH-ubiquinone oxidoreductase chain 2 n=1 Tax=Indostomus paradoxus TaxID=181450 RepID=Q8HLA4_INDPA|nr:NADH dehydrogenase subunit 2 [Indostomus paradoxus]BAC23594.1 NADH dehydrogenase subunit 2 [Indostomus paradoxus]